MANESLKKFLDSAGVSHLWTKIDKKVKNEIEKEAERVDTKIGDIGDVTVKAYVDAKTEGIANNEAIIKLQKDVDANTGNIATLTSKVDTGDETVTGYVSKTYATKTSVEKVASDLDTYRGTNNQALADLQTSIFNAATKQELADGLNTRALQSEFAEVKSVVDNFFASESEIDTKLDQLKEIVEYLNKHEGDASEIVTDVAAIQTKVNTLLNLGTNDDGTDTTVVQYVNARLDVGTRTVKEFVTNLVGNLGEKTTVVGYIDAAIQALKDGDIKTANDNISKLGERVTALEEAISKLPEVPSLDGYATEEYVQNYIANNIVALTNEEIDTAVTNANTNKE